MRIPDYQKAKTTATQILRKQNFDVVDIDVRKFNYNKNIIFIETWRYCDCIGITDWELRRIINDGCTIHDTKTGIHTVIYNDRCDERNQGRVQYTLAHEVGHIYLDHGADDDRTDEIEANTFASQLLMPEYSILRMYNDYGYVNQGVISAIFGVSKSAAQNRLDSLKRRKGIYYNQDDIDVYELQSERIRMFYESKNDIVYHLSLYTKFADEITKFENRLRSTASNGYL